MLKARFENDQWRLALIAGCAFAMAGCADSVSPTAESAPEIALGNGPPGACQPWPSCNDDGGSGGSGGDGSLTMTFRDAVDDEIVSDGLGAYTDGVCGVQADFSLQDAILRTGALKGKDKKDCASARELRVTFGPGDIRPARMTIEDIAGMAVGTTVDTDAGFVVPGCAQNLRFDASLGSSDVAVTRVSDTEWTVTTKAAPDNQAVCLDANGDPKLFLSLDFGLAIVD